MPRSSAPIGRSLSQTPHHLELQATSIELHHYRIVLSGTGFVTETIDGLDLYPGTPLTENTAVVSHPSAPPTLSVVPRAEGGVTAGWTAPAHDGGDSVESYLVEWDLGAGTFINSIVVTGSFTADVATDAQGVGVSVRVSATNEAGTGPSSTIATATAPSAPGSSVATDATVAARQVDLSWVAPANNGSTIDRYEIQHKLASQSWDTVTPSTVLHPTTSTSITGLTAGSEYQFRVLAVNGVGASSYSSVVTATPVGVPAAPSMNTPTVPSQAGQVDLSWVAPANNGSTIDRYEIAQTGLPELGHCHAFDGLASDNFNVNIHSLRAPSSSGLTNGTEPTFGCNSKSVGRQRSVGEQRRRSRAKRAKLTAPHLPPTTATITVEIQLRPPRAGTLSRFDGRPKRQRISDHPLRIPTRRRQRIRHRHLRRNIHHRHRHRPHQRQRTDTTSKTGLNAIGDFDGLASDNFNVNHRTHRAPHQFPQHPTAVGVTGGTVRVVTATPGRPGRSVDEPPTVRQRRLTCHWRQQRINH